MSQQFRTVTTNAGRNAVREALAQGKTVKLSHISSGAMVKMCCQWTTAPGPS